MLTFKNSYILSEERRSVILSVNPKAGRRSSASRVERLRKALSSRGMMVEILTDLDQVAYRANQLHREGKLRALIGVGGDGTAAELTNRTEPGVPISLLASGTANLLAKHLGYSFSPEKFARMIEDGHVAKVDAARANGRIFLTMVGCGLDAEVVTRVHHARMENPRSAHISYFSYIKPILKTIFHYQYPKLHVEMLSETGESTGKSWDMPWAFTCNIPRYGWGVLLAPGARMDDGVLDTCLYRGRGLFWGLWLTAAAQLHFHKYLPGCVTEKSTRLRVTADTTEDVPYQVDGDPGGVLPLEVETLPCRLTVFIRS